jgi:hypothetical protein
MLSKAKTMVLALDAADPGLVLKLARAGEMPAVHLHDPSHERHDPELVERIRRDPVRDVYHRLDGVVAAHLARLGGMTSPMWCSPTR